MKAIAERLGVSVAFLTESVIDDVEFNIEVVKLFLEVRDYDQVMQMLDQTDTTSASELQLIQLALYRAECFVFLGEMNRAVADLEGLIAEREKSLNLLGSEFQVRFYNSLGSAYFIMRNWVKSYAAYRNAYRFCADLRPGHYLLGNVLYNLGNACRENGFDKESLSYLQLAREQMVIAKKQAHPNVVYATALTYKNLGDLSTASELLRTARILYQAQNDARMVSQVRLQFAYDVVGSEDFDEAMQELEELAKDFERDCNAVMLCFTYAKMMSLAIRFGEHSKADSILSESQKIYVDYENDDLYYAAYYYREVARVHLLCDRLDDCASAIRISIQQFKDCGYVREQANSLQVYADLFERLGDVNQVNGLYKEMYALVTK